jgi:hypothetical protein
MPGYDKSRFVDIHNDDLDEFKCGICLGIFADPVVSPCCRLTYCKDCIGEWLTQHQTCPNDRQSLTRDALSPPPRVVVNLLNKLKIKCDFEIPGCETVTQLSDLGQHKESCDYNPFKKCDNCGHNGGKGHDCFKTLQVINRGMTDEINRLSKECSDLREQVEALGRGQGSNANPTLNRTDKTHRIVKSRMELSMHNFALSVARRAHDKLLNEPEGRMSTFIRNEFEKKYKSLWNCLVSWSTSWGTSVHHYENHYIYFKLGIFHFMIWESSKGFSSN